MNNVRIHRENIQRPCDTRDDLDLWLQGYLGLKVPRQAACAGHAAPFEYLWRAYKEPAEDLVVWAPRGGGKTRIAAALTLLDLLHKPGVQVRVLGGSYSQSGRLWEHLERDIRHAAGELIDGEQSSRGTIVLKNGSKACALAQSQRAVRGLHIQKLRCDEVEMFDRRVWEAAQMVTKSARLPRGAATVAVPDGKRLRAAKKRQRQKVTVAGTLEAMSTYHKPWGLMGDVIESAAEKGIEVLRWCIFDVMEKCPPERECAKCPLERDCKGMAKEKCAGFFKIEDVLKIQRRSSRDSWESEMLCKRPNVKGAVFPHFSVEKHVLKEGTEALRHVGTKGEMRLAMDFGFNSPFVCLWIVERDDGKAYVVDEYVQEARMLHEHLEVIESRPWGRAKVIACDPAGNGRNDQTAESNIAFLRRRGYTVRLRKSRIADGIEMLRLAICPAAGEATLFIHPRCVKLIRAMQQYHYAEGGSELPVKDGADHCVDALRYHFMNRGGNVVRWRAY